MFYLDKLFPRTRLPDLLPWDLAVDDRTLFTKVGGLLQVAHVVAPDLDSASGSALDTHYDQLAALEGRLDDGWTLFHDQWRWLRDANLPLRDFGGNRAAQLIDAAERRQFAGDRAFDNTLFVAAHYEPDNARAGLMEYLSSDDKAFSRSAMVRRFRDDAKEFFGELSLIMPQVTMLEGDALGSYISQVANYEATPACLPPLCISQALGSSTWRTGIKPQINRKHIRTVELYSMGSITADTARMLHQFPFECRWVVRIDTTAKHRQAKWLHRMRQEYEQRRQSIPRRMIQHFMRREEPDTNPAAGMQVLEVDQLKADVELGDKGFAPITMNVRVWDPDPEIADQRAFDVEVALKNRGFRAEPARISAVLSILADMPGNDPQPREVPALFTQAVRISPLTGISRGEVMDGKWDGPALMLGYTERRVPVRLAFHGPGEDNGNMAIIGQSGGGKSAFMAKIASAALKYDGARVIVFDIGRSFMPTCLCLGGDWIELGMGTAVVQPLRHVDQPDQFILIHDALRRKLEHQGVARTHETDHALTTAMRLVARMPVEKRTMSALVKRVGASIEVREALRAFTREGQWGETFDGVVASYGSARVIGVEVGAIRKTTVLPLVVSDVFDALRYERLRDGSPSVVMFDEFHELLKRHAFRDEIDRLAREIRKHNGVMVLATQNPADMTEDLAAVVDAQCPTRVLTPNPDVLEENQARFYRALGCTDDELMQLATGYQKGDYFVRNRQFRTKMRIRLTDEAEAIGCHTTPRDIQHCFQLLAEGIRPGPEFLEAWFRHVGFEPTTKEEAA